MKYSLGIDIGSSSVKVAIVKNSDASFVESTQFPEDEMPIISHEKSWAEQEPQMWWTAFLECIKKLDQKKLKAIDKIGISYQMHGLVCVDKELNVLRPSIIWCDSRAVDIGQKAFEDLGGEFCLSRLLNSPGNFTASKLKWVKENEADVYNKIYKIMLPGDYIAMKLSGKISTTVSGLSEGVFWDFESDKISQDLLQEYDISQDLLPNYKESLDFHARISSDIAENLGFNPDVEITYKAGDQPNNALSLNVLEAGEIAATAGTSGVVYGVVDELFVDKKQRVNTFAHVNHSIDKKRLGVLLCINGVGIANAWLRKSFGFSSYEEMNAEAGKVSPGSDGLKIFPFGNGAERMLSNENIGASIEGINYNRHTRSHFARAVQEGIAFAFAYGMEAFDEKGVKIKKIKAGYANMFLSDLFAQTLADLIGRPIELYNTDGAIGAARGALMGGKILSKEEAFSNLNVVKTYEADPNSKYKEVYAEWKELLTKKLNKK